MADITDVLCGEQEANCICEKPPKHEGGHECRCGGAWLWKDGKFQFLGFPGSKEF